MLGNVLTELGRFDEGIPLLRREADLEDSGTDPFGRMIAHWFLGRALLKAQRWKEAQQSLETALELAKAMPDDAGEKRAEALREMLMEAKAGLAREK